MKAKIIYIICFIVIVIGLYTMNIYDNNKAVKIGDVKFIKEDNSVDITIKQTQLKDNYKPSEYVFYNNNIYYIYPKVIEMANEYESAKILKYDLLSGDTTEVLSLSYSNPFYINEFNVVNGNLIWQVRDTKTRVEMYNLKTKELTKVTEQSSLFDWSMYDIEVDDKLYAITERYSQKENEKIKYQVRDSLSSKIVFEQSFNNVKHISNISLKQGVVSYADKDKGKCKVYVNNLVSKEKKQILLSDGITSVRCIVGNPDYLVLREDYNTDYLHVYSLKDNKMISNKINHKVHFYNLYSDTLIVNASIEKELIIYNLQKDNPKVTASIKGQSFAYGKLQGNQYLTQYKNSDNSLLLLIEIKHK